MSLLSNNAFVFFDDEHQLFAKSAVPAPPVPVPVPPSRSLVPAGGRGGSAPPWEPLYTDKKSCSTYGIPEGVLEKIAKGGKKGETDPLKVLRDVRKTQERVKLKELKALRRAVEALKREKAEYTKRGASDIADARARIQKLEHEVYCLRAQARNVEARFARPKYTRPKYTRPSWKPNQQPQGAREILLLAQEIALEPRTLEPKPIIYAMPSPVDRSGADAILAALPFACGAAVLALATSWLVPDDARVLKFVGYTGAALAAAAAVAEGVRARPLVEQTTL